MKKLYNRGTDKSRVYRYILVDVGAYGQLEDTGLLLRSQSPIDPAGSNQDLDQLDCFQVKSTMQRSTPFSILQGNVDINYSINCNIDHVILPEDLDCIRAGSVARSTL